jgi:hypothetical protein
VKSVPEVILKIADQAKEAMSEPVPELLEPQQLLKAAKLEAVAEEAPKATAPIVLEEPEKPSAAKLKIAEDKIEIAKA